VKENIPGLADRSLEEPPSLGVPTGGVDQAEEVEIFKFPQVQSGQNLNEESKEKTEFAAPKEIKPKRKLVNIARRIFRRKAIS